MAESPLTVAGLLRPTHGADERTIVRSRASGWAMQARSRAMTVKPLPAVLVRPTRLSDLPSVHRACTVGPETQAVIPSSVLLRLFTLLGLVEAVLQMLLALVALVVLRSLCVARYRATRHQRREIATRRALGARRRPRLLIVLLAAWTIPLVGGMLGLGGGDGLALLGARISAARGGLVRHPPGWTRLQPLVLVRVVGLGTLAGLIPALRAYSTEVADNRAPRS